ncbi:MAG: flavin reductase family protein [Clostridia bacterium]|nr:flavin reductase family protein [Clostridia bacterium]
MSFKEIDAKQIKENPVSMFDSRWALITAGNEEKCNTMTASWGALGELWNNDVCIVFIRKSRYTKEFVDAAEKFTVSILPEEYRSALALCGKESGRDCDKFKKAGLTPLFVDGTAAVNEADTVFVCKKLSATDILPDSFLDPSVSACYPSDDYHTMYVGKIEKVLVK